MHQLAEQPADIVLADTALTRPDSVGFTRRVLARAPAAVIVLFGSEEARAATAAIAAGARGVIQGGDSELVGVVAKAVLLLGVPDHSTGTATAPGHSTGTPGAPGGPPAGSDNPAVVPAQRDDEAAGDGGTTGQRPPGRTESLTAGGPEGRASAAPGAHHHGPGSRPADAAGPPMPPGGASARVGLTERESQVLRGMADGKSNAEIGREIFVSEDTVKTHARRLFRKLGARDRAHAVAAGFRAGLVA